MLRFHETKLKDAWVIGLEKLDDQRGFFARTYCRREFREHGIEFEIMQSNISYNKLKHTLRGMHYQPSPHREAKLVRCSKGAIFDVIIDLRPDSSTYKQWINVNLTDENHRMLYVPKGFAHGFLTLEEQTEVTYKMSDFYVPGAGRGIRYDDPVFDIRWPAKVKMISRKDQNWPLFNSSA